MRQGDVDSWEELGARTFPLVMEQLGGTASEDMIAGDFYASFRQLRRHAAIENTTADELAALITKLIRNKRIHAAHDEFDQAVALSTAEVDPIIGAEMERLERQFIRRALRNRREYEDPAQVKDQVKMMVDLFTKMHRLSETHRQLRDVPDVLSSREEGS